MKSIHRLIAAALIINIPLLAVAQDHTRTTEPGNIVALTEVHVEPGMFNAYMNDLKTGWVRSMEAQKERGDVVSYGMYSVVSPREGEAGLMLTVVYPNWAAFDRGPDYFEQMMTETFGGLDEAREAGIARDELRTIGSERLLQEIKFLED